MPLCRQAEATRGCEIERTGIAADFPDHAGKVAAAQPLFQREQCILGSRRLDMDEPLGKVGGEAVAIGAPTPLDCIFVLYPKNLPAIFGFGQRSFAVAADTQGIAGERQCQPCPAGIAAACENLAMQRLIGQAGTPACLARSG